MEDLRKKLLNKGWTEEEINKTLKIMQHIDRSEGESTKKIHLIIYWTVLIVAIAGNFLLSVALVPFLLVLSNIVLYIIVIIMASTFGLLFNVVLKDIAGLDVKHHVVAGIFIPAIAVINVFVMTDVSNYLIRISKLKNSPHNPYVVAIIYVVFFVLPYLISKYFESRGK